MAEVTVVFTDLTGSTGVFESLGNAKATQAITRITQWIRKVCEKHNGRVIKCLGDGVLTVFHESIDAIEAVTELQQFHQERIRTWPESLKMRLQVGMARGEIVEHNNDCYGDAVNVASRLSNLSGPEQILVTDNVVRQLPHYNMVRSRSMGPIPIKGRMEPCLVHRIEWQKEISSEVFTVAANLISPFAQRETSIATIELSWLDINLCFTALEMPVFLGRDSKAHFLLLDPRVSRKHVRIEWRNDRFHLEDISSYGTWVRFSDSTTIMSLRRQECVLLMNGELALGASFEDFTVPTVSFRISNNIKLSS
ncbi:MAG: adenylate/guanylate cyclase domain-containing protein [Polaromonas sp.]